MNDLKFAFRQLLKNPGFTAVACLCGARRQAVLTVGIAIGATTAIYSAVQPHHPRSLAPERCG